MSVKILYLPVSSKTSPIAIPAIGALIGTPASIKLMLDADTVAIEDDPLEERISETTLTVYGNSSFVGIKGSMALWASTPCPISRLPGPLDALASPTEYGGKL